MPTAYEIAQRPGGKHHGMLAEARAHLGVHQLRSGIAKMTRRIHEHEGWIADPASKPGVQLHPAEDVERWRNQKWPADIERLKAQRAIYGVVLKEKEDGSVPGNS